MQEEALVTGLEEGIFPEGQEALEVETALAGQGSTAAANLETCQDRMEVTAHPCTGQGHLGKEEAQGISQDHMAAIGDH